MTFARLNRASVLAQQVDTTTNSSLDFGQTMPRRGFLKWGGVAMATAAAMPLSSIIMAEDAAAAEFTRKSEVLLASFGGGNRTLSFKNTHTDEQLTVTYWRNGGYEQAALDEINYILRDFRTGDVHPINCGLLNLLSVVKQKMGVSREPVNIISGYRSPKSNAALRNRSEGVARRSYHLRGMAIDIRLPNIETAHIARQARALAVGGVGYYPESDFVHVDVGPVRTW